MNPNARRVPAIVAVPLIREVYRNHRAGCCLHIVLDDNNVDDSSVEWCMDQPDICNTCRECGEVLRTMSITARTKAIRLFWKEHRLP